MTEQTQKPEPVSQPLAGPRDETAATAAVSPSIRPWERIKTHKVVQWTVAYGAAAYMFLHGVDMVSGALGWPHLIARIVTLLLLLGVPLTVTLAWFHGHRGHQRVGGPEMAILAALLVLAATVLWFLGRPKPEIASAQTPAVAPAVAVSSVSTAGDTRPSIAVLPFENRSDEPKDAYFADGMHDDILMQLTKIGALRVIARTSVEQFRDTKLSTKDIGGKLGVTTVLEGGVQRAGDRVRVTVQLIDALTDTHLWAEAYDRELTAENIFAIQSEVAESISDALKANLTPGERRRVDINPTKNLDAWEAYQLARQRLAKRTTAGFMDAEKFAQKAIDIDPQFALAYSTLAETLELQIDYANMPERVTHNRAQAAVEQALKIDPDLSEAWATSGLIANNRNQTELAEQLYRRAIELDPNNSMALKWQGQMLVRLGRMAEGRTILERAAGVDPLSAIIRVNLADAFESQAQFAEATTQLRRAIEIDPSMPGAYDSLGRLKAYALNQYAEAIPLLQTAVELDPGNPNYSLNLAALYFVLADDAKSSELFGRVARRWPDNAEAQFWLGVIDVFGKDYAGAARRFQRSLTLKPTSNPGALLGLREVDLHNNRCKDAVDRYRTAYPQLFLADDPRVDWTNYFVAIDVSLLFQKCGDTARGNALLSAAEQVIRRIPRMGAYGYDINDVKIHALRGDKVKALTALREAKNAGWRYTWRYLPMDPNLAVIREEPAFKAIYTEIERDIAKQRAEFKARPKSSPLDLSNNSDQEPPETIATLP